MKIFQIIMVWFEVSTFVIGSGVLLFYFAFKDVPGPDFFTIKIIIWSLWTYVILGILTLLLWKLVGINALYIFLIPALAIWISISTIAISFIQSDRNMDTATSKENIEMLNAARKDFICSDGSFFEVDDYVNDRTVQYLRYYSKKIIENPKDFYNPKIGNFKFDAQSGRSENVIVLNRLINTPSMRDTGIVDIDSKFKSCKNSKGVSLSEIYKFEYEK